MVELHAQLNFKQNNVHAFLNNPTVSTDHATP